MILWGKGVATKLPQTSKWACGLVKKSTQCKWQLMNLGGTSITSVTGISNTTNSLVPFTHHVPDYYNYCSQVIKHNNIAGLSLLWGKTRLKQD